MWTDISAAPNTPNRRNTKYIKSFYIKIKYKIYYNKTSHTNGPRACKSSQIQYIYIYVRFLHFTSFSQITIELEPDIYYQWCSKMTVMRFVVKVYLLI